MWIQLTKWLETIISICYFTVFIQNTLESSILSPVDIVLFPFHCTKISCHLHYSTTFYPSSLYWWWLFRLFPTLILLWAMLDSLTCIYRMFFLKSTSQGIELMSHDIFTYTNSLQIALQNKPIFIQKQSEIYFSMLISDLNCDSKNWHFIDFLF